MEGKARSMVEIGSSVRQMKRLDDLWHLDVSEPWIFVHAWLAFKSGPWDSEHVQYDMFIFAAVVVFTAFHGHLSRFLPVIACFWREPSYLFDHGLIHYHYL